MLEIITCLPLCTPSGIAIIPTLLSALLTIELCFLSKIYNSTPILLKFVIAFIGCIWCKRINIIHHHIMAGRAFMVAKEIFRHRYNYILTLWEWWDDEKRLFFIQILLYQQTFVHWEGFELLITELYWLVQFSHKTCIGQSTKVA